MYWHSFFGRVRPVGLAALLLVSASSHATVLTVPYHAQENDQWCWAGVSQMSLEYFGKSATQPDLANYGTGGVNTWNYLTGSYAASGGEPAKKGIDLILKNFGDVGSTLFNRALTQAELKTEIEGSRPAIARLGWYSAAGAALGGHFIVLRGYDEATSSVSINDPWPDTGQILKDYSSLAGGAAGTYSDGAAHKWTHTLTLSASLDVVFLIDSTGSMGGEIDDVKVNATALMDNLTTKFKDYRVAVGDYRDNPDDDHGELSDWILTVRSGFTTDVAAAKSALGEIFAGGGLDVEEAVYSALYRTVAGTEYGGWRDSPTQRLIIIMGDAPGHYPAEPWSGGHSQAEVVAQAIASKVTIQALLSGSSSSAETDFTSLAAGSGGALWKIEDASQAADVMRQVIDTIAADTRFPRGSVADFKPTFVFKPLGEGMANSPKKIYLELQLQKKGKFKTVKRVTLPPTAEQWTPPAELAKGVYQWRLGFLSGASKVLAPDGSVLKTVKGGTRFEDSFQQFERTDVEPGFAEQIDPSGSFTPSASQVTYQWSKASNASKYALVIYQTKNGKTKLWRKLVVKAPKGDTSIITKTIKGHSTAASYFWSVEALNFDHPKPSTLTSP